MSGSTVLATGTRRHNEKAVTWFVKLAFHAYGMPVRLQMSLTERWVANSLRHESVQLHRRLRILGLQQQRELARVRWAQLQLTRTLDRLKRHRSSMQHALTQSGISSNRLIPLRLHKQQPLESCCPNHIVCSSCNLRLRLADVLLHRFTPSPRHSGPCIATRCLKTALLTVCIACQVLWSGETFQK